MAMKIYLNGRAPERLSISQFQDREIEKKDGMEVEIYVDHILIYFQTKKYHIPMSSILLIEEDDDRAPKVRQKSMKGK